MEEKAMTMRPAEMTDKELYDKCREYGMNARMWSRRFAGLIPEVARRRLYKRRGFGSIHQFASMVGGLSEYTVDKILHLSEILKDKPVLLNMLESGEEGWSKIEKVAYVATVETDGLFAEKIKILPARALEVFVQNYRGKSTHVSEKESKNETSQEADYQRFSFPVSNKVDLNLRVIKQHLEKKTKESLTWNQVFETVIEKMEVNQPQLTSKKCPVCAQKATVTVCDGCAKKMLAFKGDVPRNEVAGRNIPIETKRFLQLKYGSQCGFPGCNKPWVNMHHTRRFALNKSHDPQFIVPLCKDHHDLAHAGMIENEQTDPKNWKINEGSGQIEGIEDLIDLKVQEYKNKIRRGN